MTQPTKPTRAELIDSLVREALAIDTSRLLTPEERCLIEEDLRLFLEGNPQGQDLLRAIEHEPVVQESGDVPRDGVAPAASHPEPLTAASNKRGPR